jgi:SIR2-like domain
MRFAGIWRWQRDYNLGAGSIIALKINNHHNVYILGAGFSQNRGLPLIKDFMLALRDAHPWLLERGRLQEAEAVEHVLQYRLDSAPASYRISLDLENIEELFSLADTGKDVLSRHIRIAIAATLDYKLELSREPTTTFASQDPGILPAVWRQNPRSTINYLVPTYQFFGYALIGRWADELATSAFLTFNYDCLLEDALKSLGYEIDCGLRSDAQELSFLGAGQLGAGNIRVLKLHGSVNWMRKSRSGSLQTVTGYTDVVMAGGIPEIVPPTWRKLFAKEVVKVWKKALDEIERATRIVVIGFSMPDTDLHFKFLLASGLRRNVSLREIVFVDPAGNAVTERARQLFGDLDRRPPVRVIENRVTRFINGGTLPETVFSIDRGIPGTISNVQHSVF